MGCKGSSVRITPSRPNTEKPNHRKVIGFFNACRTGRKRKQRGGGIAAGTREGFTANAHSVGLEYLQHFFQLGDGLADQLLVVAVILLRLLTFQTLAGAADGKSLIVQQRAA